MKASLPFVKMHGLGNDFVIIDGRMRVGEISENFLRSTADRKRGVGCDQFVILRQPKSADADVFLEMYNADGSSVRACGNATRCVAQLMFQELKRDHCVIETVVGLLPTWQETPELIGVDFGEPLLKWHEIPLARELDTLRVPLSAGILSEPCCVNVGNPHAVFFVADISSIPLEKLGPLLENDPLFPDRCNIEIAQILSPDRIRMRVWERGTGITEACGSGALATLVAGVRLGWAQKRSTIILDGGELICEWRKDNHVHLIGSASFSFIGSLECPFDASSVGPQGHKR